MIEFALTRGFKLKYSTNYYPQGNGLAESTNKNIIRIIKWTIDQNKKLWHKALTFSLWADRITRKASIWTSPFHLVYGKQVILLLNIAIPSENLVQFINEEPSSALQLRISQIIKLEEERNKAKLVHAHLRELVKNSFDINLVKDKNFEIEGLVLKWDKVHEDKGKHTKFQKL